MVRNTLIRVFTSVLCFTAFLAAASPGVSEETLPLDQLTFDQWYGIYMQGKKVGYAHLKTGPIDHQGMPVFQVDATIKIEAQIESMKMQIGHRSNTHFATQAPWKRLRAQEVMDMAGARTTYKEAFVDGRYSVTTLTPSGTQQQVTDQPSASLADHFAIELACLRGVPKGYKGESLSWNVETMNDEKKTFEFLRVETRISGGVTTSLAHVREIGEDGDASEIVYEMETGRIVQWSMGSLFTMRLEPKEMALDRSKIRDYVLTSNHSVDRKLGFNDPTRVERCHLFLPGLLPTDVKKSPRLDINERDGGVEIWVRNEPFSAPGEATSDPAHFLKDSPGIQSAHPEMVALAQKIVGLETSPRKKAERIVHWVYANVEKSRLFDTDALTVLRKRKGDCSEHSILAVALARASGIPAQKEGGMMYAGDRQNVFVAHAWVRFYLEGAWVEMDPTWDQVQVDATHITLTSTGFSKLQGQKIQVLGASGATGLGLRRCANRSCRKLAISDSWTQCPDCAKPLPELSQGERWEFPEKFVVVGRMYRNRERGFQIEIPGPRWSFITDTKLVQSQRNRVPVILHSRNQRYAMVRIEEPSEKTLEEYAKQIRPKGQNPTRLGQEKITIHDREAIRIRWKSYIKEEPTHFSYALIQDGNRFYQILCWCSEAADPETAQTEFETIQQSFRIRGRPRPQ
ncbi:MAG: transglutaminase-like domain-containing protein [Planctomycetota bacterium]|nr:transglutaminase-like domain-containing protein [Planctomycetota bacterium]